MMESLRIRSLATGDEVTAVVVEAVRLVVDRGPPGQCLVGVLEPLVVVVRDPGGIQALSVDGAPVNLAELELAVPELRAQLEAQ